VAAVSNALTDRIQERGEVGRLTQAMVARAAIDISTLDHAGKVRLADEIFVQQPNLLGSILVLSRMGATMPELEVALHVLLVAFQAMKKSGHHWDIVTEDIQEACLQRLTARSRFNEGLPVELGTQVVAQFCNEHAERYLLAFAYGYLGEHDLLQVRTEAENYLLLAVLNLVECIAYVGAHPSST
jgi:hypothetical protein